MLDILTYANANLLGRQAKFSLRCSEIALSLWMSLIAHFGVTLDWLKLGAEDSLGSISDIDPSLLLM